MITFKDGPARGVTLTLKRAPLYLRVTHNPRSSGVIVCKKYGGREWDALDQIDDKPMSHEALYVYKRITPPTKFHMRAGRSSGWYMMADYRLHSIQPDDAVMRDNQQWQDWTIAQQEAGAA